MKFRRKPRENVEINLASLIDVVFILLLFFVVTTTFTRETQLKVDLPEAATGTPQPTGQGASRSMATRLASSTPPSASSSASASSGVPSTVG